EQAASPPPEHKDKPTDGDIDSLIKNGAPIGQRSEAFARVVWSRAGIGRTREEIETELRQFSQGIAGKFLEPRDRLRAEIDRCFEKRGRVENSSAEEPENKPSQLDPASDKALSVDDFYCYMPLANSYIFTPTGEMWPAASVNARVPSIPMTDGPEPVEMKASAWLARHRPVEQMTWAPGLPALIKDRVISGGGWKGRLGSDCFNLYRPPVIEHGDAT